MNRQRLEIHHGDITALGVDAIVNAANSSLLGGGGVDGAIHRAAGPALLAHCRTLGGCPPGEARLTPGFALPARWIIHTVGPIWHGGDQDEAAVLERCYRNSLAIARAQQCASLAFPAISCGVYGFPPERAAVIAVETCLDELQRHALPERITLVAFDQAMAELLGRTLARARRES